MSEIIKEIRNNANVSKARGLQRFFKTGKGEYGEGDRFLGLTVPQSRSIAKKYRNLELIGIGKLLRSKFHEERLIALLILVDKFRKLDSRLRGNDKRGQSGNDKERERIFRFYLKSTKYINNWDLVDLSADKIVGAYLSSPSPNPSHRGRGILEKLAKSNDVWERRIAIISTFQFIKKNQFQDTLKISRLLLSDKHDLIHKVVGWMLREVGKRSRRTLEIFLLKNYKNMPRTMLRYAIERFPEKTRRAYLQGKI